MVSWLPPMDLPEGAGTRSAADPYCYLIDLPAMLAGATVLDDNPEIREEDYASTYMAVQNLCVAAPTLGLGTHIKSGAVMDDPNGRAAVRVPEGERIVATIYLGEPASVPEAKERRDASDVTTWLP